MEDLATLEISRVQCWQWLHHQVTLNDGPQVTRALVMQVFAEELARIDAQLREALREQPVTKVEAEITQYYLAAAEAQALFTETELRPFLASESELAGKNSE